MPRYPIRPVQLRLEAVEDRLAPAGPPPTGPTALDGRVWEDLNADGTQDPGEPGLAKVRVELRAAAGSISPPVTAKTDAQGAYHFDSVTSPGSLRVIPPAGYAGTVANVEGADKTVDSDFDPDTGTAAVTTGGVRLDAGLIRTAAPTAPALGFGYGLRLDKGQVAGPNGLAVDAAGNVVVLGLTASANPEATPVASEPYVARYDPVGKLLWKHDLAAGGTLPVATAIGADGGIYVLSTPVTAVPADGNQMSIPPGETPPELQKL